MTSSSSSRVEKVRHCYESAKTNPSNAARSPQAIQRDLGQYAELTEGLQRIQSAMVKYTDILLYLADGAKGRESDEDLERTSPC
jgi:hypothetical protein